MPSLPLSSPGAKGSILLVEEYDALAAAILSALKKFAPGHAVRSVPSLVRAEIEARAHPPDLLILDFDPPLAGALDYLSRLREIAPAARVIIICAGLPHEVLRERRARHALGFLEKPFQLPDFGEAVRGLLGLTATGSANVAQGALSDLNLADIIPLLGLAGASIVLGLRPNGEERDGEIHFVRGQIRHASTSGLQGLDALREMLRWSAPEFYSCVASEEGVPRTLEGNWPSILSTVLRSMPRTRLMLPTPTLSAPSPTQTTAPAESVAVRDGKKVLIIDDTELLRVFVEEMLSSADPRMQIASAPDGSTGLKRCAEFRPDLILLDFSLPDFNGDEVCRRLLEDETMRQTPVIMMSGHTAEMAAAAETYENIVLTLPKPFISQSLIDAVSRTLSNPTQPALRKRRRPDPPTPTPTPSAPPASKSAEPPSPPPRSAKTNGENPAAVPSAEPVEGISSQAATALTAPPEVPPTPAHIPVASSDRVVLSIPLNVVSMQYTAGLHIKAIRARPPSAAVFLHVDPRAVAAIRLPEATFEIDDVALDARGQMGVVRVIPIPRAASAPPLPPRVAIEDLEVVPSNGLGAIQFTPASGQPLAIQLLAAFELGGVELSPSFTVSHLVLHARGGRLRVIFPGQAGRVGICFETAQLLLDRSGRIAEVLLDSVVA